jgi:branched-chain amino acid aminotransferase
VIEEREVRLIKPMPSTTNPYVFGRLFTDHMLSIDYTEAQGWSKPKIQPYGPFTIATTATSLHYGISCYEGISIVQNAKTSRPQAFRAEDNLKSFEESCDHLDMPKFSTVELLKCIKELVKLDESWFPHWNNIPG